MMIFGYALAYTLPFMIQIFIGSYLFSQGFQRKENYKLRLILSIVVELILTEFAGVILLRSGQTILVNMLLYFILFLISMIYFFNCYEESWIAKVDCGISAYLCQHMFSQIMQAIRYFCWDLPEAELSKMTHLNKEIYLQGIYYWISEIIMIMLLYSFVYYYVVKIQDKTTEKETSKQMISLSIFTLTAVIGLSAIRDYYAKDSMELMLVSRCFSILCCLLIMIIRSGMLEVNLGKQEKLQLQSIHAKEIEQYEQQKQNMELINIKCHDLRRRMDAWEEREGHISTEEITEMRQLIRMYDYSIKTGNETLDQIIAEKSLVCNQNDIRLSVIADGSKLSFMSEMDIYSLFDNSLSNAITAVSKLTNVQDRVISMSVRQIHEMLVISIENYYVGQIEMKDGLPLTTNEDKEYHGFGVKSIALVAKKYKGSLVIKADKIFTISVMIPIE